MAICGSVEYPDSWAHRRARYLRRPQNTVVVVFVVVVVVVGVVIVSFVVFVVVVSSYMYIYIYETSCAHVQEGVCPINV